MEKIILIAGILNAILATIVFVRAKNRIQKTFSYLIFIIAIWAFTNVIYYNIPTYPFVNISYSVGAILIAAIFLWISDLSNKKISASTKTILFISVIVMILVSLLPGGIIKSELKVASLGGLEIEVGPLFIIYALPAIFILLSSLVILIKRFKSASGLYRLQLFYILLGFLIPIGIVVIIDFILPNFGIYDIASLDVTTSIIFVGFISYAIFKHRFMDIKVVLRKGFVYFLSLTIILFFYIYLLIFSQKYFAEQYALSEQTSIIILVLIIVLTIEPLRRFLLKVVDRAFYKRQKNAHDEARKLRLILSSSFQFDQLIKKVSSELKNFMEVSNIQFLWHDKKSGTLKNIDKNGNQISINSSDAIFHYLKDNPSIIVTEEIPYLIEDAGLGDVEVLHGIENKLNEMEVGLVLPIGEPGELIGLFLFSRKVKKKAFTSDNIEYLTIIKAQMTGVIANALLYKQAVERIGKV